MRKPHIYRRSIFWMVRHRDGWEGAHETFALACRSAYLSAVYDYHGHVPPVFEDSGTFNQREV